MAVGTYIPGTAEADTFQLLDGVTIKGGYAGYGDVRDVEIYETILSGDNNRYHVVTGSGTGATAVLDGFTVTGGNADGAEYAGIGG